MQLITLAVLETQLLHSGIAPQCLRANKNTDGNQQMQKGQHHQSLEKKQQKEIKHKKVKRRGQDTNQSIVKKKQKGKKK